MKSGIRKFLKRASLTAAFSVAAVGSYSYAIEPNNLKTAAYDIQSPKWPQEMPPLNVAMAADFHVGAPNVTVSKLEKIVQRINDLKPDIIVLPGDFLTMTGHDVVIGGKYVPPDEVAAVLKNLKAPLGVYAVLGNHDVYNDPNGMQRALENAGIRVLENDAAHVQSADYNFWVAGLADDTSRKPDWKKTSEKITDNAPVILIMHDPGAFMDKNERPVVSLAAHTHGGQFLPFLVKFFDNPVTRAPNKYMYGHITEDGRELIVTSGIGTSVVPLRLGARPEIVKIKIHSPGKPSA